MTGCHKEGVGRHREGAGRHRKEQGVTGRGRASRGGAGCHISVISVIKVSSILNRTICKSTIQLC